MKETENIRIGVYGTLRVGEGAYGNFRLGEKTVHLGTTRIPGVMYHLGAYPGARLEGAGEETFVVDVLEFDAATEAGQNLLQRLDNYEGYQANNLDNSLYLRKNVETAEFGEIAVYEINDEMANRRRVAGGDWCTGYGRGY